MAKILYRVMQDGNRVLFESENLQDALDYMQEAYEELDKDYICHLTDKGWCMSVHHPKTVAVVTTLKIKVIDEREKHLNGIILKF